MSERAFTLIAKTIQSLANFCDFGAKEAFLIPLNPFMGEQKGWWGRKEGEKMFFFFFFWDNFLFYFSLLFLFIIIIIFFY